MAPCKDGRHLHAQADQVVDVEEAPVIDLLESDLPRRQPEGLIGEQRVEGIERTHVVLRAVDFAQRFVDGVLGFGAVQVEAPEPLFDGAGALAARAQAVAGDVVARGETVDLLFQFVQLREPGLEFRGAPHDHPVGLRVERQAAVVVADEQPAVVDAERQLLVAQHVAVEVAQDRQQHAVVLQEDGLAVGGMPVDIEELGVLGGGAVLQHVAPPGVFGAGGHVVGHEVEQQPHAVVMQLFGELLELLVGADFGVDAHGVGDVVAVRTAAPGLEPGRGVEVADAELVEVRDQVAAVYEPEPLVKLQAVSGERDAHDHSV